jgi:hypothetical protein
MFLLSFIFVRVCGLFEWMWIWPCFCCHVFLWEYMVFLSGCESGHVFVVIYFCESTWSFWVDVNLAMFLLSFIFVRVCGLFEWMWIWPCFCCHLFLWEYVVFLSGCESGHVYYCLFIYVLPLKIQLWRGRAGILLTGLTQPHFYACPKPRPGFPAKIGWLGIRIMCQEWSNKSTSRQLIQWASNIKIQLIVMCLD